MKSYFNYFKLRVITNLQYRAAAVAGILTQLFFGFVIISIYYAFYTSSENNSLSMNYDDLVSYLWLQQAFFSLTYPFIRDNDLLQMIRNGNIAYELIRPQNFYLKYFIKSYANRLVNVLLRFIPVLIIGYLLPYPFHLSLPYSFNSFILFMVSLFLSSLLVTSLCMIVHMLTMVLIDSKGTISTYTIIAELFMGQIVPIAFLPNIIIKVGNYLPFKYLCDLPYRAYSGNIVLNDGLTMLISSSIWIIITITIGVLITKKSLKKAVIQGG